LGSCEAKSFYGKINLFKLVKNNFENLVFIKSCSRGKVKSQQTIGRNELEIFYRKNKKI